MGLRCNPTPVWLARGDFRGGAGGQKAAQMGIDAPTRRFAARRVSESPNLWDPRLRPAGACIIPGFRFTIHGTIRAEIYGIFEHNLWD